VVLRLTTHVYKAHYRARAFRTRETGPPSAGLTPRFPPFDVAQGAPSDRATDREVEGRKSKRSHNMSYLDARG